MSAGEPDPLDNAQSPARPKQTAVTYVQVGEDGDGQRVDNYLLKILKGVPRTRIYRLLRKGEVRVDGKRVAPLVRLQTGQTLRLPPVATSSRTTERPPQAMVDALERRIIAEEEEFLVLDKPAGTAVHGGSGIAVGVIEALGQTRSGFLELVHRLDRDTSGILLLAKTPLALRLLQNAFRQRRVDKRYRVVVHGQWRDRDLLVDRPLTRYLTPNGERRVRVDDAGQSASSRFHLLQEGRGVSTLEVELLTGRTHQIRVHAASVGHPVVGDSKYGGGMSPATIDVVAGRLLLHAHHIRFVLGERAWEFSATVPASFDNVQRQFG